MQHGWLLKTDNVASRYAYVCAHCTVLFSTVIIAPVGTLLSCSALCVSDVNTASHRVILSALAALHVQAVFRLILYIEIVAEIESCLIFWPRSVLRPHHGSCIYAAFHRKRGSQCLIITLASPVPILSVFPALIVHSELKSVHPGFPVAFIF